MKKTNIEGNGRCDERDEVKEVEVEEKRRRRSSSDICKEQNSNYNILRPKNTRGEEDKKGARKKGRCEKGKGKSRRQTPDLEQGS
jgi:hypothetical protein